MDKFEMGRSCPECNKKFDNYGELVDHYWDVHDGNNPALKNGGN